MWLRATASIILDGLYNKKQYNFIKAKLLKHALGFSLYVKKNALVYNMTIYGEREGYTNCFR